MGEIWLGMLADYGTKGEELVTGVGNCNFSLFEDFRVKFLVGKS